MLGTILKHHRVPLRRQRALLFAAGLRAYTSTDRQTVSFYLPVQENASNYLL